MEYPKIGDKYTLAQDMNFVDANDYDDKSFRTLKLHRGEKITFAKMEWASSKKLWQDSSICIMYVDDVGAFIIPYSILIELATAGVLVRNK